MRLLLKRQYLGRRYTTGLLFLENPKTGDMELVADTIEPPVKQREYEGSVVAIPAGRYPVVVTWSPRFQRLLPLVTHVEGRSGIRIHAGNTVRDTSGCILVGRATTRGTISDSRRTLAILLYRLAHRPDGTPLRLDIKEPLEPLPLDDEADETEEDPDAIDEDLDEIEGES